MIVKYLSPPATVITKPPTTGYQRLIDFDIDCDGSGGGFDIVALLDEENPFRREVIRSGRGAQAFRRIGASSDTTKPTT
jgi:hypothetical protein